MTLRKIISAILDALAAGFETDEERRQRLKNA